MMTEAEALQALTREDPAAADHAKAALAYLTGSDGLGSISLLRLQEFLWYVLPATWPDPPGIQREVARALSRVLLLAGLDRYAEVCASPETERIIAAYGAGQSKGIAAYTEAIDCSRATPPDTDLLAWGSVMGSNERAAYDACAAALELAITSGEIRVGVSGWKIKRAALVDRWLTGAAPDNRQLPDDNWLSRISAERIDDWVRSSSGERAELATAIVPQMLEPQPTVKDALPTLCWLLRRAAGGITLTARHYIAPALVAEAVDRFGWGKHASSRRLQELHVMPLHMLRTLATREMGAVKRSGGQLVLTRTGKLMAADPAVQWHIGTSAVIGPDDGPGPEFAVAAREAALLLTLVQGPLGYEELTVRLTRILSGEGWASRSGVSLAAAACSEIHMLRHRLRALDLLAPADVLAAPVALTTAGTAAALSALLARALRPRHHPASRLTRADHSGPIAGNLYPE